MTQSQEKSGNNGGTQNLKPANIANLVKCEECSAIYDKNIQWVRGRYEGTSDYFTASSRVPLGSCPICGEDNLNE